MIRPPAPNSWCWRSIGADMTNLIRSLAAAAAAALLFISCTTVPDADSAAPARESGALPAAAAKLEEGRSLTDQWKLAEARSALTEALNLYSAHDDRRGTVEALLDLGWNTWQSGDPAGAREYYRHAHALAAAGGDAPLLLDVRNHQADLALRLGDPVGARDILGDRPEPDTESGRPAAAWYRLNGTALDALGQTGEALMSLELGVEIAGQGGELNELAQGAYRIAVILSRQADFEGARGWAETALAADRAASYPPGIAADLLALAIIAEQSGDTESAEDFYRRAWLAWNGAGRFQDAEGARRALEALTGRPEYLP